MGVHQDGAYLANSPTTVGSPPAHAVDVAGTSTDSNSAVRGRDPRRFDIQGLRALAVGLVVVFHLKPALLPGGYVGVDVFFAISGYLITAHLVRDAERSGRIRLVAFWGRRIRRLLPAALLVLLFCSVATALFVPRTLVVQNFTEIAAASVYVLNWLLAANSVDYLAATNQPSIVQHYWSLSVEEQFYIVWPLLLLVAVAILTRVMRDRRSFRAATVVALSLVFAASLTSSIVLTQTAQPLAYFVTNTRAWEFAAGGLVALAARPALLRRRRGAESLVVLVASWGAVFVIFWFAVSFNQTTIFPGWIAAIPVGATVLLLWLGDSEDRRSPQFLARLAPVQLLGDISYGIYLWHWPLIVLAPLIIGHAPGWKTLLAILLASVLLALGTKRLVEDPIRFADGAWRKPLPTFGFMAAGMALILAVTLIPAAGIRAADRAYQVEVDRAVSDTHGCFGAYSIVNSCQAPYARTSTVNPAATISDSYNQTGLTTSQICTQTAISGRLQVACALAHAELPTRNVVVIGDSHVDSFTVPLQQIAKASGWSMRSIRMSGCSGFAQGAQARPVCAQWGDRQYARILSDPQVDTVIVAIRSDLYGPGDDRALAGARFHALRAAGKQVIVIRTVPGTKMSWPVVAPGPKAPECVERTPGDDPCAWQPPQHEDGWLLGAARAAGAPVIDTWKILCDTSGTCHQVIGGTIAYFDDSHLATTFARTLEPWLAKQLSSALAAPPDVGMNGDVP